MQSERPAYYRCTRSTSPLFTVGVAYEVYRYDSKGIPEIITDDDRTYVTLPHPYASFVGHDPWAEYKRKHGNQENRHG